jgi:hypothetical protein
MAGGTPWSDDAAVLSGDDPFHEQVVMALLRVRHLLGLNLCGFARRLSVTPERLADWDGLGTGSTS